MELRARLLAELEAHYRERGWPVSSGDGVLTAKGPGGVEWVGTAVVPTDLDDHALPERLANLGTRRMADGGELCPLDVIASSDCEESLQELLARLDLAGRAHVSLYSLAAA